MFWSLFKSGPSNLDEAINATYAEMRKVGMDDEKYPTYLKQLKELEKLKRQQRSKMPSPDALLGVAGTFASILLIVAYEQKHVLTSKGLGFIPKFR